MNLTELLTSLQNYRYFYWPLIVGILLIAIAGGYYLSKNSGEIKIIHADTAPTRIRPEDPGGKIIAYANGDIYNQFNSGHKTSKANKVVLLPEPEQPINIAIPATNDAIGDIIASNLDNSKAPAESEPSDPVTIIDEQPTNALQIVKLTPETKKNQAPRLQKPVQAFYIQLASTKTEQQAITEWDRIKKNNKKLLANLEIVVAKYSLADRRIFYRLLVGPFAKNTAAKALCKKLIASKQSCLVTKH